MTLYPWARQMATDGPFLSTREVALYGFGIRVIFKQAQDWSTRESPGGKP